MPQFLPQFALASLAGPVALSGRKWDTCLVTDGSPELDTTVPHSARVWNYWLGGEDNYPADRLVGDQVMAMFPDITRLARADRAFLGRAVRYLAAGAGIRQFLDIGTGLPTAGNTHEVAQAIAPESRVVYVDNDPLVLVHARALLTSTPEGATAYVDADLRDTGTILERAAGTLDFARPVALMMLGIMGQIPDSDQPASVIARLMSPMAPGSYLALSDGTTTSATFTEAVRHYNENSASTYHPRRPEQIAGFFAGLNLVEPGVVELSRWRPDGTSGPGAAEVPGLGGVARKP
jgi:O-methyltransferase involved in polyketide biosynthesis